MPIGTYMFVMFCLKPQKNNTVYMYKELFQQNNISTSVKIQVVTLDEILQ